MRRSSSFPFLSIGLAVILGACETAQPTEPVSAPAMAVAANAAGGALIIRGERVTFLVHLDVDRQRMSVHAPSNVCTIGSLNTAQAQFVVTPSRIGQFIAQLKSDSEAVAVYHATSFAEAGMTGVAQTGGISDIVDIGKFCGFLTGPQRIAEGTVRRVSNFSNASFSAHWTGMIQDVGGDPVKLTEVYQLGADAQDPNDVSQWVVHVSKILLSP